MTKEQKDGIVKLMREHLKREADDILLKSILDRELKAGKVSPDWRAEFTRLQKQKEYLQLIQEGEDYIAEVVAAIDRNEAISEFLKNPPKGRAN